MAQDLPLNELWHTGGTGKYPTDKEPVHGYLKHYEKLFAPYRYKKINIFEIGYLDGGSVRLWEDYFPYATIKAIDVTNEYRDVNGVPVGDRVTLELRDAKTLTKSYFDDFPPDIIIDDGSHLIEDWLQLIPLCYSVLRPGGIMLVEDIHNIDAFREDFKRLQIPFEVLDLRHENNRWDNVVLIYRK
jgi:hypothetical protein